MSDIEWSKANANADALYPAILALTDPTTWDHCCSSQSREVTTRSGFIDLRAREEGEINGEREGDVEYGGWDYYYSLQHF